MVTGNKMQNSLFCLEIITLNALQKPLVKISLSVVILDVCGYFLWVRASFREFLPYVFFLKKHTVDTLLVEKRQQIYVHKHGNT